MHVNQDASSIDHIVSGRSSDRQQIALADSPPPASGKEYLRRTLVSSLFPENRCKIVHVYKDDLISQGFQTLIDARILSAPVLDSKRNNYVGFIDIIDIVCQVVLISKKLGNDLDAASFDKIFHTDETFSHMTCGQLANSSSRNPYYPIEETAPLMTVLRMMVEKKSYRVAAIDHASGLLSTIVTQSHVVSLIRRNLSKFNFAAKTVGDLKMGYKDTVLSIKTSDRVIDAFNIINDYKIHGLAVVDATGKLIDNISASDLKYIGAEGKNASRLFATASEYLQKYRGTDDTKFISEPYCVLPSDTVQDVIEKLAETHAHRVYVVDGEKKPIGVISLSDILQHILEHS